MPAAGRVLEFPASNLTSDAAALESGWPRLLAAAAHRHGAFSRSMAIDAGVTPYQLRRAVAAGRVERWAPQAFRVAGSPLSWHQQLVLACDALGHGAVASRHAAGALHGFPRCRAGTLEVTSDQHRTQRIAGVVAHSTSLWAPADLTIVDGVPCTDPYRTFIDLGADLPEARHEEMLDELEHLGIIDRPTLEERLSMVRVRGRNGVGYTGRLLEGRSVVGNQPTNALERRFLRLMERAGLPRPECQVRVRLGNGSLAIVDFLWPDLLFAVETDGHGSHAPRAARAHDNQRAARLLELGIELVRFTWEQVRHEPALVTSSVSRHLDRRRALVAGGLLPVSPALVEALRARRVG